MRVLEFAWDILKNIALVAFIVLMVVLIIVFSVLTLFWTPFAAFCLLWAGTVFAPAVFVMGWKTYFAMLAVYYFATKPFSVAWTEKRKEAFVKVVEELKDRTKRPTSL